MVGRRHVVRILAQALPPLDVRVHGLPLDRPRPDERDLDGKVVEILRAVCGGGSASAPGSRSGRGRPCPRPGSRGIPAGRRAGCARGRSSRRAGARSGRRTPRPPRASRARAGRSSGSPRRRTSPCPTGRAGGPPSRPARSGRARTSGRVEMTMPPGCWERWRGRPAISPQSSANARQRGERRLRSASGQERHLLRDAARVPAVREAREPLELGRREPERLADVADRAARAVGGEARDERRVLAPVLLADRDDQLLPDVAREVEVDVGHGDELPVQEAPQREVGLRPDPRARGRSGSRRSSRRSFRDRARAGAGDAASRGRAPRPRPHGRARAPPSGGGRTPRGRARR